MGTETSSLGLGGPWASANWGGKGAFTRKEQPLCHRCAQKGVRAVQETRLLAD